MDLLNAALRNLELEEDAVSAVTSAFAQALQSQPADTTLAQERAAANDEARTLATVLKPTKPKPYHGAIDAVACLNFIENQEEYFEIVGLNRDMWVKYTAVNLEDDAKDWWRDFGLTMNSPWNEFHDVFVTYHTPPNAVAAARQELDKLKQNLLSIKDYTHRFRRLTRLISNMDSDTALFMYMKGLEPETSKEVRLPQPETMAQAVHQASIVHGILHPIAPTVFPTPNQARPTTEPMDVDAMRVLLASLSNNTTNVANFRQPLTKLTPAERERPRKIGACFRCRVPGHRADQCGATRDLNNLEADNTNNDAGKGQGEML
ncbi:hypothetical protein BG011_000719 [Mortierella polycephala]|uniref:CCHC-type domain-containing protein n=1 Tax=Mortierella polycephala TaxID=41804 RepID=A0A9P6U6L1_9FUNG|nr:hypothetical protein BG011_000719 [Mortierella polycephala]